MAKKKEHTGFRNGKLFCFHCGDSFDLQLPQPVSFMSDIMKSFAKRHANCPLTWKEPEPDMNWNIKQRIDFWFHHGERGMSSEAIFYIMTKGTPIFGLHHPYDIDDFKRCYGLLKMVPEWRSRMSEMKKWSKEWSNLVDHWDVLSSMYENVKSIKTPSKLRKNCDIMYELIKKCINI